MADEIRVKFTPPQSNEDLRQQAIRVAKQELVQVIARDKPSSYRVYVDGTEYSSEMGNPEEKVRFGGVIQYKFSYTPEIVQEILTFLREVSPEQTGPTRGWNTPPNAIKYKDHHIIIQDGQIIKDPAALSDATEVWITNLVRYARKIEINFHDYYTMSGPYEKALQMAKRRFGNMMQIKLTWLAYPGLDAADPYHPKNRERLSKPRDRANNIRYPTLIIAPL